MALDKRTHHERRARDVIVMARAYLNLFFFFCNLSESSEAKYQNKTAQVSENIILFKVSNKYSHKCKKVKILVFLLKIIFIFGICRNESDKINLKVLVVLHLVSLEVELKIGIGTILNR